MSASIKEVAERAGVSTGTVSHVLNGNSTAARISLATQERIRQAAKELDYRPNRLARSLGRRKTDTIGLLISGLRNPFFVDMLETAQTLALESGYDVFLDSGPSYHGTYLTHGKVKQHWPLDGALVWATPTQTGHDFLGSQADSIPLVYMGAQRMDDTDWVSFDYAQGGYAMAEHLYAKGYRSVAYVSPYAFGIDRPDDARHAAFQQTWREFGQDVPLLLTEFEEESRTGGLIIGAKIAALPATSRPDALFCHNDMIAIGVYCALRRAGLRVPEDIAVAGFDGTEDSQFLEIPLTTVRISGEALSRKALEILTNHLRDDTLLSRQQVILPTELIQGQST